MVFRQIMSMLNRRQSKQAFTHDWPTTYSVQTVTMTIRPITWPLQSRLRQWNRLRRWRRSCLLFGKRWSSPDMIDGKTHGRNSALLLKRFNDICWLRRLLFIWRIVSHWTIHLADKLMMIMLVLMILMLWKAPGPLQTSCALLTIQHKNNRYEDFLTRLH